MDETTREKLVAALENAVLAAGAKDYETGMMQARRLLEITLEGLVCMQTKDDLRNMLDSLPPTSWSQENMALFAFKAMPKILRIGLKMAAKKAALTLPPPSGGRPRVANATQAREVINAILQLVGKGCTPRVAKDRTAQKFGLGRRTIHRIWQNRGSIKEDDPTLEDVLRYFSDGRAD